MQVFIPGPHDPVAGASEALPRARLLQQVVQPLIDRLKAKTDGMITGISSIVYILMRSIILGTAPIFTTSPARFRYGRDEEIVTRCVYMQKLTEVVRVSTRRLFIEMIPYESCVSYQGTSLLMSIPASYSTHLFI